METSPAANERPGLLTAQMTKKQITEHYAALPVGEQKKVTGAALDWLADRGVHVSFQALHYWRNNETPRSPLSRKYQQAYAAAIKSAGELQPAEQ